MRFDENGNFSIKEKLAGNSSISSREIWGVNTNQFIPVSVISYSPNYFDEQDGIGHRAKDMYNDGYKFFLSQNSVWLTKEVPICYLEGE